MKGLRKIGVLSMLLFFLLSLGANAQGETSGDSCGSGKVLDCALNCVDEATARSWTGDGYCDDQNSPYGYVLTCPAFNNDGGDCGNPGDSCGSGKVFDCAMNCVYESTAQAWTGDGYCDDENSPYGYVLTCPAFNNDGGDCGGPIDVIGTWTESYDYDCDGIDGSHPLSILSNGDFLDGGPHDPRGTWTLVGNQITLTYQEGHTVLTGTVYGDYMEGTFYSYVDYRSGCWSATR